MNFLTIFDRGKENLPGHNILWTRPLRGTKTGGRYAPSASQARQRPRASLFYAQMVYYAHKRKEVRVWSDSGS